MSQTPNEPNFRNNEIRVGRKNNIYQHIMVLKENRYKRHQYREVFIEGVSNINAALKFGWKIKNWIYQTEKPLSDWAKKVMSENRTTQNFSLSEELLSDISGKSNKSELMGIFEMKEMKITPSRNPLILLCNKPSKKGNLGSIIRSADAFGCDGVIVTGHAVDIYDPEIIGASMGSYFAVAIEKIDENEQVSRYISDLRLKYPDLQVVATTDHGDCNIRELDYTKPTILLMGNETDGLSLFYWDICDKKVKIPMVGEASSLNLACATTVFLYEIFSQRHV
jgi:23S rRNA (uridine2479-2'-O)-methyltransferase